MSFLWRTSPGVVLEPTGILSVDYLIPLVYQLVAAAPAVTLWLRIGGPALIRGRCVVRARLQIIHGHMRVEFVIPSGTRAPQGAKIAKVGKPRTVQYIRPETSNFSAPKKIYVGGHASS